MANVTEIKIDRLHPTQLTLGMAEVRRRAKDLKSLSNDKLRDYLRNKKSIPHVIGPGGQVYIIDHHHLCRALLKIDVDTVYLGEQKADWSHLELKPFWVRMEAQGYCWPIDADGNRRPCTKIPSHVSDLTDNPWRTLARAVRGKAFSDQGTPDNPIPAFQEFHWGNYYRSFMSLRLLETNMALAEDLALRLSVLDEAQDLPGFMGTVRAPAGADASDVDAGDPK